MCNRAEKLSTLRFDHAFIVLVGWKFDGLTALNRLGWKPFHSEVQLQGKISK
jgi:hypothetical protein